MHGELIFQHPEEAAERRVPGNAVAEGEDTLRWEFHDRGLSENDVARLLDSLETIQAGGGRVRLAYTESSPPLEEVESGPEVSWDQSEPGVYDIVEVNHDASTVLLRSSRN